MVSRQQEQPVSRRAAVRVAGSAALAGAVAGAGLAGRAAQAGAGAEFVGAWRITAIDTTPGGPPPETLFATFFADGNYIQSASGPSGSTGHGTWQPTGERRATLTFQLLVFGATPMEPTVVITIRAELTLDTSGTVGSGPYRYAVALLDGTAVAHGEGTARATRISR